MQSLVDVPASGGSGVHHGYTEDDDGNVWYWTWDEPAEYLEFREDAGYPTDHPIRSGEIPDDVRDHAQTYVDSLLERDRMPWY